MEQRFRIVFQGKLQAGSDPALVRRRVAAQLKASPEQLGMLFSGARIILKKNLTAVSAKTYLTRLGELGLQVELEAAPGQASALPVSRKPQTRPEADPVILQDSLPAHVLPADADRLVSTLTPLDVVHGNDGPDMNMPARSGTPQNRQATAHEAPRPHHDHRAAPVRPAEAPLLFRTSIVCGECGTRHIIEGRLLISVTPVDEPVQQDLGLR